MWQIVWGRSLLARTNMGRHGRLVNSGGTLGCESRHSSLPEDTPLPIMNTIDSLAKNRKGANAWTRRRSRHIGHAQAGARRTGCFAEQLTNSDTAGARRSLLAKIKAALVP